MFSLKATSLRSYVNTKFSWYPSQPPTHTYHPNNENHTYHSLVGFWNKRYSSITWDFEIEIKFICKKHGSQWCREHVPIVTTPNSHIWRRICIWSLIILFSYKFLWSVVNLIVMLMWGHVIETPMMACSYPTKNLLAFSPKTTWLDGYVKGNKCIGTQVNPPLQISPITTP